MVRTYVYTFFQFTEIIIEKMGAEIQIQAWTCNNGEICIAPGESNATCYFLIEQNLMKLQEMGYTLKRCNFSQQLCLETTVMRAMNNTLYTAFCSRNDCGINSTFLVGATSKLIVAGK